MLSYDNVTGKERDKIKVYRHPAKTYDVQKYGKIPNSTGIALKRMERSRWRRKNASGVIYASGDSRPGQARPG